MDHIFGFIFKLLIPKDLSAPWMLNQVQCVLLLYGAPVFVWIVVAHRKSQNMALQLFLIFLLVAGIIVGICYGRGRPTDQLYDVRSYALGILPTMLLGLALVQFALMFVYIANRALLHICKNHNSKVAFDYSVSFRRLQVLARREPYYGDGWYRGLFDATLLSRHLDAFCTAKNHPRRLPREMSERELAGWTRFIESKLPVLGHDTHYTDEENEQAAK